MELPELVDSQVNRAADVLRAGGLVAFPTETVYGLGADADRESAVRKIFAAKGRPADHPVIVHVSRAEDVVHWASEVPPLAWTLASAFWPGPLTMILKRSRRASDVVTGGLDTVGLRVPRHPVAQEILKRFGGAIAAPSANRFGRVSPTSAEHVRREFGGRLDLIVEGGDCEIGLESTILDLSGSTPAVLRPGSVLTEQIETVLGIRIAAANEASPRASGRLASHYAPQARVEITARAELPLRYAALRKLGCRVAVFDETVPAGVAAEDWIAVSPDMEVNARELYSSLRRVDDAGFDVALVTLSPEYGVGTAIADRLRKAAGPRSIDASKRQ